MQKHRHIFGALTFLSVGIAIPATAYAQNGIRSVNFNEFSYRVGPPYCEEFGQMVRVHRGRAANEKAKFEISQVMYAELIGSEDQAVVVASCTPQAEAHPGFENGLVYVYSLKGGQPNLLATFAFGNPLNAAGRAVEPQRHDQLNLFDVTAVSARTGSISFEHIAGAARCCPTFYVTQTFRWANGGFTIVREEKRPWKGK